MRTPLTQTTRGRLSLRCSIVYTVAGRTYTNDGITTDPTETDTTSHDEHGYIHSIVSQYPVGQP